MHKPEILLTAHGFAILTKEGTDAVSFTAISAIIAYKLDEITTDLICCDIVTGVGQSERTRTIHEDLSGFDAVMAHMETLPAFDRMWRHKVCLPPFATNRAIVYTRTADA